MNHSLNEQLMTRKAAATPRGVGVMAAFFAERARERRAVGRRGPPLHRLRRRHRRAQHRPPPPAGDGGDRRSSCERFTHTCFQVVPYESYIALAERLNALTPGDARQEDRLLHHRRRGGRERGQDRARATPAAPA